MHCLELLLIGICQINDINTIIFQLYQLSRLCPLRSWNIFLNSQTHDAVPLLTYIFASFMDMLSYFISLRFQESFKFRLTHLSGASYNNLVCCTNVKTIWVMIGEQDYFKVREWAWIWAWRIGFSRYARVHGGWSRPEQNTKTKVENQEIIVIHTLEQEILKWNKTTSRILTACISLHFVICILKWSSTHHQHNLYTLLSWTTFLLQPKFMWLVCLFQKSTPITKTNLQPVPPIPFTFTTLITPSLPSTKLFLIIPILISPFNLSFSFIISKDKM